MDEQQLAKLLDEKLAPLNDSIKKLNRHIHGDDQPDKGFIIRLDRLEQRASNHLWMARAAIAASAAALAKAAFSLFTLK
jgi:hypothetical protein